MKTCLVLAIFCFLAVVHTASAQRSASAAATLRQYVAQSKTNPTEACTAGVFYAQRRRRVDRGSTEGGEK
jgi:hypothetical protein